MYLRFAALGDSTTHGIGDPVQGGWRGWARLLAGAMAPAHTVSLCNLAVPGATAADVRRAQLDPALAHRPDLASLIVGVNDTMRSTWSVPRLRADLLVCAEELSERRALLMTVRFHDHGEVFGLPSMIRRALRARIDAVNDVYDEIHDRFGGVRIDLARHPEVLQRRFWAVDRLHPSERGHRWLAGAFAAGLAEHGVDVGPVPADAVDGCAPTWHDDLAWLVTEGAPWVGRRARDLAPWAVRTAWADAQRRRSAALESTP